MTVPASPPVLAGIAGLAGWVFIISLVATQSMPPSLPSYPEAHRESRVDDYHGESVADPYRWLEDLHGEETRRWVEAQNRLTRREVEGLPLRPWFAGRLRRLLDYPRTGIPDRENGVYAYTWNPGQAEQDVLRVTRDLAEPGEVVVDPVALRPDGTVSLGDFKLSPDGLHLAYSLSDGGSDWRSWHVRNLATGQDEPGVLVGTKFTGVSWARDSRGFFYSRYPEATEAGSYDDGRQVAVYFHRLGSEQGADQRVFRIEDYPSRDPYAEVTEDGRFLVFHIQDGYASNDLYYQRLDAGSPTGAVVRLLDRWDALYTFLGVAGEEFYIQTTHQAPRGRVIAVNPARPLPEQWREVVPQSADALDSAALIGGELVLGYVHDARALVRHVDLAGAPRGEVALPGQGTVAGFGGTADNPEAFYTYTDFTTPRTVYRLDLGTGETRTVNAVRPDFDPGRYVTREVFVTSRDGTRVPLFIVSRKDLPTGLPRPTVLYGYGGFAVSLLPAYSASRMAWIEAGGIYAQAILRGGGEYGEDWHLAGTRLGKQNVFDDFIASAEWLIGQGITTSSQLAIWGGSNGGLLVGAVLNQRPELFRAAVPSVGVMDMLRYQTASLNARQWSSDYGLSEHPEEFAALRAYSPYHNIRTDHCYPAVLVQADANDDRVAAWHSYKYAAALQAAQSSKACPAPTLIRIETRTGHGAGASVSKLVDEYADQWAFVAAATGLGQP